MGAEERNGCKERYVATTLAGIHILRPSFRKVHMARYGSDDAIKMKGVLSGHTPERDFSGEEEEKKDIKPKSSADSGDKGKESEVVAECTLTAPLQVSSTVP